MGVLGSLKGVEHCTLLFDTLVFLMGVVWLGVSLGQGMEKGNGMEQGCGEVGFKEWSDSQP